MDEWNLPLSFLRNTSLRAADETFFFFVFFFFFFVLSAHTLSMCVVCKAFSFSGVCGVNKGDDDDDDDDDGAFSKESRSLQSVY